jgi:hypothetical protein
VLVPAALVAVTVNVYVVPLTSPVTVIGDAPPVAVNPPTFEVTVYEVIADPPLLAGAVNVTVAEPLPATAVTPVGDPGVVSGVTELEAVEDALVPTAFVAVTVKVYAVPLVRPIIVIGEVPPVAVKPPVFEETVYEVIGEPPLFTGGVNEMVACPFPATAVTPVGAPGVVAGVTGAVALDGVLVPFAFVAVTVNVYVVPFVRPVRVSGEPLPVTDAPVFAVRVYEVIADPPLLAGAVNETVTCPLPIVAIPIVGAPGTVDGTTELLAVDGVPEPIAFDAVTVNVYVVPLTSPVTVIGEPLPLAVKPPTFEVTV